MSVIINDNLSEDLFQNSQCSKLRRSQRILEQKHSYSVESEDVIPPNQMDLIASPRQSEAAREQTPDFTHLHSSVELSGEILQEIVDKLNLEPTLEAPLDLSKAKRTTPISQDFTKDKVIFDIDDKENKVENEEQLTAFNLKKVEGKDAVFVPTAQTNTTTDKTYVIIDLDKCTQNDKQPKNIALKPTLIIDLDKCTQNVEPTKNIALEPTLKNNTEAPNSADTASLSTFSNSTTILMNNEHQIKNVELAKVAKESLELVATQEPVTTTKRQTKRKSCNSSEIPLKKSAKNPVTKSSAKTSFKTSPQKLTRSQQAKLKTAAQTATPPTKTSTTKRFSRPRLSQQTKANSTFPTTATVSEYVPPKVMRYYNAYNSCPTVANVHSTLFAPGFGNTIHESLLPPVYPPHFTNQIQLTAPLAPNPCDYANLVKEPNPLSISLLTPDDSEIITIESSSNEMDITTPSPPLPPTAQPNCSPLSLRNFFEVDDINDIFDLEKPVFELTELQVRALAFVLNMNSDELFQKLTDIVKADSESLRKIFSTSN